MILTVYTFQKHGVKNIGVKEDKRLLTDQQLEVFCYNVRKYKMVDLIRKASAFAIRRGERRVFLITSESIKFLAYRIH
ncbi:hypothetical protein GCM10007063_17370 [Lentibacillus kapialis]|uniref:Uncharacterized protein n=1 Tax=Lentibacillus kapialis TaxID=340214 RepID=A0A917PWK7_9BACI|nr:hypothetical protein GCM10007063_17370 [Lentibacillus kapialis]